MTLVAAGVRTGALVPEAEVDVIGVGGRVETSLKTCLGSRNLGSICCGAKNPVQTTKISAETFLKTWSSQSLSTFSDTNEQLTLMRVA